MLLAKTVNCNIGCRTPSPVLGRLWQISKQSNSKNTTWSSAKSTTPNVAIYTSATRSPGAIWTRQPSRPRPAAVSDLLVRSRTGVDDGCLVRVTPQSAGWRYVGFEVYELAGGARLEQATIVKEATSWS